MLALAWGNFTVEATFNNLVTEGEEGDTTHLEWWFLLSCQETGRGDEPCVPGSGTCVPAGSNEWIPDFALLVHTYFALPVSCVYLNPWVLLLFPFFFSPPSQLGRVSKQLYDSWWQVKPQQFITNGTQRVQDGDRPHQSRYTWKQLWLWIRVWNSR